MKRKPFVIYRKSRKTEPDITVIFTPDTPIKPKKQRRKPPNKGIEYAQSWRER